MAIRCLPDLQASPKTVFVTGATGFIGQRLLSALSKQGVTVRAMVRPGKKPDGRLPPSCEQVESGLTDVKRLSEIVVGCSAVIYCAGSVRGRNTEDFSLANIRGVEAISEALAQQDDPPPLLLLSSLAASRPELSDYAFSKHAGEQVLRDMTALPWTILRPPAVYGPGDREMLPVLKMIRRGLVAHAGPVNQRLSLLHVDDLARAVISWLAVPQKCLHQTYAIDDGTPGGYGWNEMAEAVNGKKGVKTLAIPRFFLDAAARANLVFSRVLRYSPMLSPGKVRELVQPEWLCDNAAYTDATGWQPGLDLKQGVQQLFG